MGNKTKAFVWLIICLVAWIEFEVAYIQYHEEVHRAIYRMMGIDSRIEYIYFKIFNITTPILLGGKTIPIINNSTTSEEIKLANTLQTINEMIGYHILAFLTSIIFLIAILGLLIIYRD